MPTKAPTAGEHTDAVLDDVLGYDAGRGSPRCGPPARWADRCQRCRPRTACARRGPWRSPSRPYRSWARSPMAGQPADRPTGVEAVVHPAGDVVGELALGEGDGPAAVPEVAPAPAGGQRPPGRDDVVALGAGLVVPGRVERGDLVPCAQEAAAPVGTVPRARARGRARGRSTARSVGAGGGGVGRASTRRHRSARVPSAGPGVGRRWPPACTTEHSSPVRATRWVIRDRRARSGRSRWRARPVARTPTAHQDVGARNPASASKGWSPGGAPSWPGRAPRRGRRRARAGDQPPAWLAAIDDAGQGVEAGSGRRRGGGRGTAGRAHGAPRRVRRVGGDPAIASVGDEARRGPASRRRGADRGSMRGR